MKKISILGCGWLGFPLAKKLLDKGYTIKGSSRRQDKMAKLKKAGIDSFIIDLDKNLLENNFDFFLDTNILVLTINSKKVENHKYLLNLIKNQPISQIIYTSSTGVYQPSTQAIDENGILVKDHPLVEIEKIYQKCDIPTCILRLSGLVGPDRHPGRFFRKRPEAALAKVPTNLIHLDEVIKCILWIINHAPKQEIYNVTSREHPNKYDFYHAAYEDYYGHTGKFKLKEHKSPSKLITAEKLEKESGLCLSLFAHYPKLLAKVSYNKNK